MTGRGTKRENKKRTGWGIWLALVCVLILSFSLNTAALDWGQTGSVSWTSDSIEGRISAIYMPQLFKMWTHKYPRGHFLLNAVFYKPILNKWQADPVSVKLPDGTISQTPIDQKRLYKLATVSRHITIMMSMGIIVAVFLTARKLFDDNLAGILSILCLALSCHFMFYSKSGNVDIPAFFWFAWAGCFGLYAIKSDNLFCYFLAGFCAAWSVCTKESVAAFHVGLAAGLAVLLVRTKMQAGQPLKKALLSLIRWKVLAATALAVFVFLTLEGFWGGMEEWQYRSQFWSGRVERPGFKIQGAGVIALLQRTYTCLYKGWGYPFLILLLLSLLYWMLKYRWQLFLTLLPLLAFFFLTVLVVSQNHPRWMMCGYSGIAIIMGKALADWFRFRIIPIIIRSIFPLLVLVPSFICCVCYNIEMKNDTRVRAENWMKQNANVGDIVGLSMQTHDAPRIWFDGFRSIPEWDSKGVNTQQGKVEIWPDYLIASNQWPCTSKTDKEFFKKLFKGEAQYQKQVQFDSLYFNKETLIWKYCLRFYDLHERISPRMMVYEK
ncbi:MAG: ArnT family glycosyltransferase [Planctomycetota bacterium]|jgi:hypothetical protein